MKDLETVSIRHFRRTTRNSSTLRTPGQTIRC